MNDCLESDLVLLSRRIPSDFFENRKILITGASGLIGNAVARLLLCNKDLRCEIYLMSRSEANLAKAFKSHLDDERIRLLPHDVTERLDSDVSFDYMIDCASYGNPKAFRENPVGIITTNVVGVNNLLSYGMNHGLKRMVYVSSGEVYGEGDGNDFQEEDSGNIDYSNIRSCYPVSKRAAEALCRSYSAQYGMDVVVARPCHVFGPNFTDTDDRAFAQFFRNVVDDKDIVLKSPATQVRSWLYVADCAYALIYLLIHGKSGEAYNVATLNETKSIREFAQSIAAVAHKDVIFEIDDVAVRNAVISRGVLDSAKLHRLGWSESSDIDTGIAHTYKALSNSRIR